MENSPPIYRWVGEVMKPQSVKRTAEPKGYWMRELSVVRFTDFGFGATSHPALKRWAIFIQSAART